MTQHTLHTTEPIESDTLRHWRDSLQLVGTYYSHLIETHQPLTGSFTHLLLLLSFSNDFSIMHAKRKSIIVENWGDTSYHACLFNFWKRTHVIRGNALEDLMYQSPEKSSLMGGFLGTTISLDQTRLELWDFIQYCRGTLLLVQMPRHKLTGDTH